MSIVTIGKTVIASAAPGVRFRSEALFGHVVKRGYLGSALRFAGEVVDGTGEPADGVSVVVLAGNLDGSGMTPVASTVSAHRGRFLVRTPRGGPRLLAVEAGGTLLEEVRQLVSPTVWVGVRSVRGARLVFHGRVFAPGTNPAVMLQSRTPRGWQTFAGLTPNAANHGFAYVYRPSPATVGYRYAFRAVTLPADPWISGASHAHDCTVRP
ncbi:MAG: hypothetical protein ABSG43_03395 [Solirubrobacteraceae bacterium]